MKRYLLILLAISAVAVSCSRKLTPANPAVPVTKASSDIVILYDNDVHCSVDGYEQMSALKAEKQKLTPYVTLVSSGDFVQGGSLGAVSRGGYIVEIMNAVGYDLVTLGNHEFDYGIPRLKELTSGLTALTLCCPRGSRR